MTRLVLWVKSAPWSLTELKGSESPKIPDHHVLMIFLRRLID